MTRVMRAAPPDVFPAYTTRARAREKGKLLLLRVNEMCIVKRESVYRGGSRILFVITLPGVSYVYLHGILCWVL